MKVKEFNQKKIYSEVSGVTALVEPKIKIELNPYGLYEELVQASDTDEISDAVRYVSPYLNEEVNENHIAKELYHSVEGIQYDRKIGYYLSLYAGHVNEQDYRLQASSGGIGTWIFSELLSKNLIDGVIHVKPSKNGSDKLFKYDISRTVEEILEGSKTRYYPVELSEVLSIVKQNPGRYAIIGIPSFIMAVRLLAHKDPIIKDSIKFTVGIICGHQKSSKFAESMAWQVGIKPGNLRTIDFRKKLKQETSNNYGVEFTGFIDDQLVTITKKSKELIGHNWGQGYFKPLSSDFTDDVMNETADITLGDAWLPEYTQDSLGNNIVIVRHPVINKLLIEAKREGRLNIEPISLEKIIDSQLAHFRHTQDELTYRLYKKHKKKQFRPQTRTQASHSLSFLRTLVQDTRETISTKSHIYYRKAVETDDFNYFYSNMMKLSKRYTQLYRVIKIQKEGFGSIVSAFAKKLKRRF